MNANQNISSSPSVNNSLREHYSAPRTALGLFFFGLAFVVGLCIWAATAQAQVACAERGDILAGLSKQYNEAPIAAGVVSGGGLVEVLISPDGSTWTILMSSSRGKTIKTCIIATGEAWRKRERPSGDPRV